MSEAIYTFNGKDITLNVCVQIRGVVNELQKRLNISFPDAMLLFYRSETYKVLQQTENAFWAESVEYIADRYFEEMKKKEGLCNRTGGETMPEKVHNIVYKFAQQIRGIYGDSLKKVVVYGSYARGDYQKNSDIDIMILVDANDAEIKKRFNSVCDLAFDYELEYGIVISPLVKNEEHFMKWSETLPFYRNVKQEGVTVDEL